MSNHDLQQALIALGHQALSVAHKGSGMRRGCEALFQEFDELRMKVNTKTAGLTLSEAAARARGASEPPTMRVGFAEPPKKEGKQWFE